MPPSSGFKTSETDSTCPVAFWRARAAVYFERAYVDLCAVDREALRRAEHALLIAARVERSEQRSVLSRTR